MACDASGRTAGVGSQGTTRGAGGHVAAPDVGVEAGHVGFRKTARGCRRPVSGGRRRGSCGGAVVGAGRRAGGPCRAGGRWEAAGGADRSSAPPRRRHRAVP